MSDSQTQSYTPAQTKPARKTSVVVWFVVLLVALAGFATAVVWAGGPGVVEQLLGSLKLPNFGSPSTPPAGSSGVVVASVPASSTLPIAAQERMYAEQLESRVAISDLVSGKITSLSLGVPKKSDASATVPVTALYKDGNSLSGVMTLRKYNDLWYFFSIAQKELGPEVDPARPASFDAGVVSTITQQQALPATQEMITGGLLGGGYREVKIGAIANGPRTATIDVTMTSGTEDSSPGRFVLISKTDGATTYWFVARFEKR